MSDPNKPDLLVPDTHVVSIDEARAQRKTGPLSDFVTRAELLRILDKISDGIAETGQQVYDAIAEQNTEHLARMEHTLRQELLAEIRAHDLSLWGRLRRRFARRRTAAPRIVDAVEAMDPTIAAVVHTHDGGSAA